MSTSHLPRRAFLGGAAFTAVAAASVSRGALAALPEPVIQTSAATAAPLALAEASTGNPRLFSRPETDNY